jgi:two-component system response regulator CpxR
LKSLLIIDDDIDFCDMLRDYLSLHDFRLNAKHDGSSGLAEVRSNSYDLLLLDVMLPDMDGHEVLRELKKFSSLGVLMLSTLGCDDDRIAGLGAGADDYLPKPFNPRELMARVEAILRRLHPPSASRPRIQPDRPGLVLNRSVREAYYQGNRLRLTDVEFSLLSVFLESPGTILGREDLVARVFQRPFNPLDRSLDMHISRLRRKLSEIKDFTDPIKTIRSSGYLFSPQFASCRRQSPAGAHSG